MRKIIGIIFGSIIGFCFGWHCSYIHTINQEDVIVADGSALEEI